MVCCWSRPLAPSPSRRSTVLGWRTPAALALWLGLGWAVLGHGARAAEPVPAPAEAAASQAAPALAPAVLELAGHPVRLDEFYFWVRHAARHDKQRQGRPLNQPLTAQDWQRVVDGLPLAEHLRQQAIQLARQSWAVALQAQAQGLRWQETDEAELQAQQQRDIRIYSRSEYARIVARMYGSQAVFTVLSQRERLGQRLFEARYGPNGERCTAEQVADYVRQAQLIHLKYLWVPTQHPQAEALVRALRAQLLQAPALGAAWDAAIREHGADDAMADAPDGRLIARSVVEPAVAQAYDALPEGSLSEVLRTERGFYLLQRLPITPEVWVDGRSLRAWAAYNHLFKADVARWADALPWRALPALAEQDLSRWPL